MSQHRCLALNRGLQLSQRCWCRFGGEQQQVIKHAPSMLNVGIWAHFRLYELTRKHEHNGCVWSQPWRPHGARSVCQELGRSCQLPGLRGAFSRAMLAMFATFNKCQVFELLREKQYFGDCSTRAVLCGQIYVLFLWCLCSEQGHTDTGIEKTQLSHNSNSCRANLSLALQVKIPFSQ